MADTLSTTTSLVHNLLPEVMGAAIADAVYSESIMFSLAKIADIGAAQSKTAMFNYAPVETAAASSEGVIAATEWLPLNATIGVAEIVARVTPTKLAQRSGSSDLMPAIVRSLSSALYEKAETDACAIFASFTNSIGTSGNPLTIAQVVQGIATLRKNAKAMTAMGRAVMVLFPEQIYDLQIEGISKTNGLAPALAREEIVGLYGGAQSLMQAQSGSFMGVPVFSHNLVPSANTAADSAGALFIAQDAIGIAVKWMPEVAMGYAGSAGVHGDYMHATMAYGAGLLRNVSGVKFVTDR